MTSGVVSRVEGVRILDLVIPGEPRAKQRARTGRGRTYTPAATVQAETAIAWDVKRALRSALDDAHGRYALSVVFHCGRTPGPDLSNLVKLLEDALNPKPRRRGEPRPPGLIWRDDSQIVRYIEPFGRIDGSDRPRTEITIYRLA